MVQSGKQPAIGQIKLAATWRSKVFNYGFAVAVTGLMLALRLSLTSWIHDRPLLILFILPIIFSAYVGGLGPGLLATGLSTVGVYFLVLTPTHRFWFEGSADLWQLSILVLIGLLISLLIEALHRSQQRIETAGQLHGVTLASIGDAVITTDSSGHITFLNGEAERLTGWTSAEACGQPLPTVFHIVNEATREPVEDPVKKVFRNNGAVGLANHTVLISRQGADFVIDDSGAPIRNPQGKIIGVVLVFRDNTEKKHAEDAVRESQALYHSLVNQMPTGVFRKDATGRYVFVNKFFCDLRQATPEMFLGKLPAELPAMENPFKEQAANHHARIMQSGCTIEVLDEYRRADGEKLFFQVVKTPVFNAEGQVVGSQGVLFDVTQNKLIEERLGEVIKHTQCIVHSGEVTGPPGWEQHALDDHSPFVWNFPVINPEAAQTLLPLDLRPGEAYEQGWTRSCLPSDHIQMNHHSGQALLTGAPIYWNEFRCTDKNGKLHWMLQQVRVIKIAENRWQIFGITTDVTSLKTTEELYRTLFNLSPAGFLRQDEHGKIIDANAVLCQLTGYAREEIIGQSTEMFALPQNAKLAAAHREKILAGGSHMHEVENRTRDGRNLFVKIVETCVTFPDGHKEILCNVTDISSRKQAELLMEQQKQILEMIATGRSLTDSLTALCRLVESQQAGSLASVLLLDADDKHLRHGAAPNLPEEYCNAIDGVEIGPAVGSCGTAAFLKKPVFVADIATDPHWKNFSTLAAKFDLRACWSTPIFNWSGNLLGTFAVYARRPGMPSAHLLEVIEVATHTAAVAINRQRVEQALQTSENRFHTLVNLIPDFMFVKDTDGRFLFVNPALAACYGQELSQMLGRTDRDFLPPALVERFCESEKKVLATDRFMTFEDTVTFPDGKRRTMTTNMVAFRNNDGVVSGLVGIGRDITDRMAAEAESSKLAAIVESSDDAIVGQTLDGIITSWNSGAEKIFGYTAAEALGKSLLMLFPKDRIHEEDMNRERIARGQTVEHLETIRVRKDGKHIHVFITISPLKDATGKIIGAAKIARDITKRKQAETALHLSEFSVNQASLPTFWIAPDARIVRANHAACAQLGYTEAEVLQLAITDLDPDFPAERWPAHWQELRERKRMRFETRHRHKDGHIIPVEVELNWFEFGGQEYNFAFVRDITERQRLEEQLRQSQKMEAIGQLSGGIAHDFNNLLTAIHGNAALLDAGESSTAEHAECVGEIIHAASRAAELSDTAVTRMPTGTETILIAEDETPVRNFASKLLQRLGYQVLLAENGVVALQIWSQHHEKIALVLTDIVMPEGMKGYDLAAQLLASKPGLKIIYTSGYASDTNPRRSLLSEGKNFIRKPFTAESLAEIIRHNLDGKNFES